MPSTRKKLDKITERPLRPYKHIHYLNGYTIPKDKFFKYMPLDRFMSSVDCMSRGRRWKRYNGISRYNANKAVFALDR